MNETQHSQDLFQGACGRHPIIDTIPNSAITSNIFESSAVAATIGPVCFCGTQADRSRKMNPNSKKLDVTNVDVPTPKMVPDIASALRFQRTSRPEKSRSTLAVTKYRDGGGRMPVGDLHPVRVLHQRTATPGIPINTDRIPTSSSGTPIANPENHI